MVKIISKYLLVFIYFYFTLLPKRFQVSGVRCQVSAQPLAVEAASLIEKETLSLASFI